jgi:lipopolysaccharide biosynthesis glycosyltransferase
MDFEGKTIGMSIEPTIDKGRIEVLELGDKPYYNAGVLMVDLKRWRKIHAGDKIIKYYKKFDGKLFANDQDAINGAMKDEIVTISPKYNFYNIFLSIPIFFFKKTNETIEIYF